MQISCVFCMTYRIQADSQYYNVSRFFTLCFLQGSFLGLNETIKNEYNYMLL